MSKERKDDHFIKKPIYVGGTTAFKKFIKDNLKYPKEAFEKKVEGTVLVRYDIDYKGRVTDAKVKKGIGHGCDEEAMRVIKLLKFEVPKGPRKLRVSFHKENKINFKLPKAKVKAPKKAVTPTKTAVTYSYVPKKKPAQEKPKKRSYNYIITTGK